MVDFCIPKYRETSKGHIEVYPDFIVRRSSDLMIRGGSFYAVWDSENNLWSMDEYVVERIVDKILYDYAESLREKTEKKVHVRSMNNFSSASWTMFKTYIGKIGDNYQELDSKIIFENTPVTKEDHISRRLSYSKKEGSTEAFDSLFSTLYTKEELDKIMWAIGSIISGDSKKIQKFFVLFGAPGTGKSTVLNLIYKLFSDYTVHFEAQTLTGSQNSFPIEVFRNNPLVGINHEGNLSVIRDNSLLSSIVGHDEIPMNVKYQKAYTIKFNTMLFIATNKPVAITDSKSGLIRRLIDIRPTGDKVEHDDYDRLIGKMETELGAIAYKCELLFRKMGKHYYDKYRPMDMMLQTNTVYNFVDEMYYEFLKTNKVTLARAWDLYKNYCESGNIINRLNRHQFREEFKTYWQEFHPYKKIGEEQFRSLYIGFLSSFLNDNFSPEPTVEKDWLILDEVDSYLDHLLQDCKAQYANPDGLPTTYWDNVETCLSDIDTTQLHYILPTSNHIVIDFDLRDKDGKKSLDANINAAREFPPTYAERSKGGEGLHLHYFYKGDVKLLKKEYKPGIEVLAPIGKFAIRRRLSTCNDHIVEELTMGLPLKESKKVISIKKATDEKKLRELVKRILKKDIHPATKPSMDFLFKVLNDTKNSGVAYDLSDMKTVIYDFARKSTNNPGYCLNLAVKLPLVNEPEEPKIEMKKESAEERLTFFDIEVFPNLFLICWKYEGDNTDMQIMINPSSQECESLFSHKLVGYNNRRYDNHILFAGYLGYTNLEIYKLSSRIIGGDRSAYFKEAYNISYADVLDYAHIKKKLKRWQIELGIPHKESPLPWDQPVPVELWDKVIEYCSNDVKALEYLHHHLSNDFNARVILSELSGLTPNDSTLSHTSVILFGKDKNPQDKFLYPNLADEFPGYTFVNDKSDYNGEDPSEGGFVYSVPGIYKNVTAFDVASMHPSSICVMELFGPYTKSYKELLEARLAIKNGDYEKAKTMFDGRLEKHLKHSNPKHLAEALKIIINSVYGFTYASFPNKFRDPRNIDNVVAKRGALFMMSLKNQLNIMGAEVIHIKTDGIKIHNCNSETYNFIMEYGKQYGYTFGIDGKYSRLGLINNADYIALYSEDNPPDKAGKWEAVGSRFSRPYVFKTLFTKEPLSIVDYGEKKSVDLGNMYLEQTDGSLAFVGQHGIFYPVNSIGSDLVRINKDKKYYVTGTKGYKWITEETMLFLNQQSYLNLNYYQEAIDSALDKLSQVGDINLLFS